MLPLHRTFKSIAFVLASPLVFISCSNHSKQDISIINALNESIEGSNKMLSISTSDVVYALRDKMYDPATKERAQVWYPKAEQIQKISKELFDYIENLKSKIMDTYVNSAELFTRLKKYQKQVLEVDSKIADQFHASIKVFTRSVDSLKDDQQNSFQNYFKQVPVESAIAVLSKLQNNIRINETRIVTYCFEQVGKVSFGPCEADLPLVTINSSIVQPNEKMEIIAGNGTFYTNRGTKVFIYGRPIEMREDGVAEYNFKASSKPGKYYIPVRVNYIDQNGKEQSVQKEIEYTVANIQNQ